jgi:hypothetical protein
LRAGTGGERGEGLDGRPHPIAQPGRQRRVLPSLRRPPRPPEVVSNVWPLERGTKLHH